MTIDEGGKWWIGSEPRDIEAYLKAYAEEGYGVQAFRLARCTCGSERFELEADGNEGAARRTCAACGAQHFMCDSAEYWDVRWIHVGARCASCGILGCFADWKIDYEPSTHLMEQV